MSTNTPDPNATRPGGLQAMLARLRGMMQGQKPPEAQPAEEEIKPDFDAPPQAVPVGAVPVEDGPAVAVPLDDDGTPLAPPADDAPVVARPFAEPAAEDVPEAAPAGAAVAEAPAAPQTPCPICDTPRVAGRAWCDGCGYIFPAAA